MAVSIIMPKAGMSMEEGTIVKWFKKEGEKVEKGEQLLEILTDKVNMEVEAPKSGVLLKILKGEGEVVPVTNVIAYIGEIGEKVEEVSEASEQIEKKEEAAKIQEVKAEKLISAEGKVVATPAARRIAKEKGIDIRNIKGTGIYGEVKLRDIENIKTLRATPLAERIANAEGIELSHASGTGYNGKITKEDISTLINIKEQSEPAEEAKKDSAKSASEDKKPLLGMRKIISDRMLKSHLEIPPVTLNAKADVTDLLAIREKINTSLSVKITINDFVLKAVAMALKEYPNINVSLSGNEIIYKQEINVGVAVALDEGLIVPVIKDIDKLSLKDITLKSKELSAKAREGKLIPDEISGGTFTVSNLGMYDITSFTPIINLPESAILGVCAIEEELKLVDGEIKVKKMMGLSLTFDHRVIDGAQAAIFLKRIKTLLQSPLEMLV